MGCSVVKEYNHRCFMPPHFEAKIGGEKSQKKTQKLKETRRELQVHRIGLEKLAPSVQKNPKIYLYTAQNRKTLPGESVPSPKNSRDTSVKNAYNGAKLTVDFFKDVYGRNSIDNRGMDVISTVHFGKRYPNAYWNGEQMVYGDGNGEYVSFTSDIDVIGHEITHGVTDNSTADFEYEGQSGALNESVSDIFGSQIKQYSTKQDVNQADWLIGDFVIKDQPSGKKQALRTMKDELAYDDARLGKDDQPKRMSGFLKLPNDDDHDNGGVHSNSGIPNHWFYLLSMELGKKRTVYSWEQPGHIVYEVLTNGSVGPKASFVEFANATIAAATKLYQKDSDEYNATISAWKQVEVL